MKTLRLGLIGGNITESHSPALHMVCGLSVGLNVTYDLLIPQEQGLGFAAMLKRCEAAGFDGVNVTYPYKEDVLNHVRAATPVVAGLGASNTVVFSRGGAKAHNTDHTGFVAAYREKWGAAKPGRVVLLGCGGVGRAIAFALADLGADDISLQDVDGAKAQNLQAALKGYGARATVESHLSSCDGIINATPLGMVGREGSPLAVDAKFKARWGFDAVYTPEQTAFRAQLEQAGAAFLGGYELYVHQGLQAFALFSGRTADADWVRQTLMVLQKNGSRISKG